MTIRILTGDALETLGGLADESVHCCLTSPPYFGLRDYSTEGQIGLEPTPEAHIARLVEVFGEVRRVLRKDGVLWLNYGDSYASNWPCSRRNVIGEGSLANGKREARPPRLGGVLKDKDLMMMPSRVALSLQADGWWLRSMLPWVKRSAMPESVTDRPASAIEYVFLFSKSGDTLFWQHRDGGVVRVQPAADYRWRDQRDGGETAEAPPVWREEKFTSKGKPVKRWKRVNLWTGRDYFFDMEAVRLEAKHAGRVVSYDGTQKNTNHENPTYPGAKPRDILVGANRNFRNSDLFYASITPPHGLICSDDAPLALDVNPAGFAEAHFATFPPKLIEPLIKAGTSEKGCCAECGAPWVREVEQNKQPRGDAFGVKDVAGYDHGQAGSAYMETVERKTTGWSPSCGCNVNERPCTVLDPFLGAGTTALVADRLGRDAIGIELNPEYAEMARARLHSDAGMFAELEA